MTSFYLIDESISQIELIVTAEILVIIQFGKLKK